MKVCYKCGVEKSLSDFHVAKQGKYAPILKSFCKECMREYQKEKYKFLDEDKKRKRREKNPCNTFEWRQQYRLKNRFGLTTEEFSAMVLEQNNKCKICECEMDVPQIDHNHTTGEVRSLLCRCCNTSLGLVKEDTKILYNMISYINAYL